MYMCMYVFVGLFHKACTYLAMRKPQGKVKNHTECRVSARFIHRNTGAFVTRMKTSWHRKKESNRTHPQR